MLGRLVAETEGHSQQAIDGAMGGDATGEYADCDCSK